MAREGSMIIHQPISIISGSIFHPYGPWSLAGDRCKVEKPIDLWSCGIDPPLWGVTLGAVDF